MNDIEKEIHRKVNLWMAYADEDLHLSKYALKLRPAPCRLIAYHAQQCAEKCLKAYLVFRRVDFPYTHNISLLLELCTGQSKWAESLQDAEELTAFAITTRYPGEDKKVTMAEAVRAIELASSVRQAVKKALADEGMAILEDTLK